MMRSRIAVVLLVVLIPSFAYAEDPAPSLSRSIERVDFQRLGLPASHPKPSPRSGKAQSQGLRKFNGGLIGGVVGFLAGGVIGGAIDRCRCDDPGLTGFMVGAPIGAVVGAIVGVKLMSR